MSTIAEIDFTKIGTTPIGKIKVADVKEKWRKDDGKSAILWVKVEGFDARAFQMWEPKGGKTVSVGDEFDVSVEVKEGKEYQGSKPIECWLIPAKSGGNSYSRGGGNNYQPKDEAPIACQVMIKEAGEIARFEAINKGEKQVDLARMDAIFDGLTEAYVRNYPKVKGAHGA